MRSNAKLTGAVETGSQVELTWTLDNPRDVHRMVCHVRSLLCNMGIPNRIKANPETLTVGAVAIIGSRVPAERLGRLVAEAFA